RAWAGLRPVRRHDAADRGLLHLFFLREQHRLRLRLRDAEALPYGTGGEASWVRPLSPRRWHRLTLPHRLSTENRISSPFAGADESLSHARPEVVASIWVR